MYDNIKFEITFFTPSDNPNGDKCETNVGEAMKPSNSCQRVKEVGKSVTVGCVSQFVEDPLVKVQALRGTNCSEARFEFIGQLHSCSFNSRTNTTGNK